MKTEKIIWWSLLVILVVYLAGFYLVASEKSEMQTAPFASVTSFLHTTDLPLWNADEYCGVPAISSQAGTAKLNIVDAFFYEPFTYLNELLNVPLLYMCLNFLLLFSGFYLLLRKHEFLPLISLFAAFLLVLMPQYTRLSIAKESFHFLTLAILPFVLLVVENLYTRRTPLWFVLTVLLTSIAFLRASVPVILLIVFLEFVFIFFAALFPLARHSFATRIFQNTLLFFAALAFSLLLSAFVFFQILDFSPTAAKLTWIPQTFNPSVLLNLLAANFLYDPQQSNLLLPDYVGIITIFLAIAAAVFKRDKFTLSILAATVVILAASFFQPLFFISLLLPILLCALAASGLQFLVENLDDRLNDIMLYTKIFILVISIGLCAVLAFKLVHERLLLHLLGPLSLSTRNVLYMKLVTDILRELAVIVLAALMLFLAGRKKIGSIVLITIILVLALFDLGFVVFGNMQKNIHSPAIPQYIISSRSERVFPIGIKTSVTGNIVGSQKYCTRVYKDVLDKTGFELPDASWSRNPFLAKYFRTIMQHDNVYEIAVPPTRLDNAQYFLDHHLLDLSSTRYLVSPVEIFDPLLDKKNNDTPFVYENPDFCPKTFFVDSVSVFSNHYDIFAEMGKQSFQVTRTAFIQKKPPFRITKMDTNEVNVVQIKTNQIKVNVHAPKPGLLVLTELYNPSGWIAKIDDKPVEIFQTDHFLMSVFVPAGAQRIEFTFQPRSLAIGIWISLTILFSLLSALIIDFYRQNRLKRIR